MNYLPDELLDDWTGRGERACQFLECLTVTQGKAAGEPLKLPAWFRRVVKRVYGDICHATGRRRIRTVALWLPRGNGKTTLVSGLSLLHLIGPEREQRGQIVLAAADKDQAGIAYESITGFIGEEPEFERRVKRIDSRKWLRAPGTGTTLKAISREPGTKQGLSVSFFIADEIHIWPKLRGRQLFNAIRQSQGKRDQPLTWLISTAGEGRDSLAWDYWQKSHRVARGTEVDPSFLPVIFAADPEDEDGDGWTDEDLWRRVNPALADGYLQPESMRDMARNALKMPSDREDFLRYHLNLWRDTGAAAWLDMTAWDACGPAEIPERPATLDELRERFKGYRLFLALDLSSTTDLTCLLAAFQDKAGEFHVFAFFFMPEVTLKKRSEDDDAPYRLWAEQGWITTTEGSVIDYEIMHALVYNFAERFEIQRIPIDRWNATGTVTALQAKELPVMLHGQGMIGMPPSVKATERAIIGGTVHHDGNPVLRHCIANAGAKTDDHDNKKLVKIEQRNRIDGAVYLAMAIGSATGFEEEKPSIYVTADDDVLFGDAGKMTPEELAKWGLD